MGEERKAPDLNENHIKHLEFIQGAIERMAGNSFLLKGWTVAVAAALFALAAAKTETKFVWVALIPTLGF